MHKREGSIVVIGAVSIVVLLAFVAVGVEATLAWNTKVELQNALDAATKAGASQLDGTTTGLADAQNLAVQIANTNKVLGDPLALGTADVVLGVWTDGAGFAPGGSADEINALSIDQQVSVGTGFASISMGRNTIQPRARSFGVRAAEGAGSVDCFIPVAIPSCTVEDLFSSGTLEDVDFVFSGSGLNSAAWVGDSASTPSASWLQSQFNSLMDGSCEGNEIAAGDSLGMNNGVVVPALQAVDTVIESSTEFWDPAIWGALPSQWADSDITPSAFGQVFEAPIAIVDVGAAWCASGGGPLSGTAGVTGFIKGALYDVHWQGGSAPSKRFAMRLDATTITEGNSGGGTNYGIVSWVTTNPVE